MTGFTRGENNQHSREAGDITGHIYAGKSHDHLVLMEHFEAEFSQHYYTVNNGTLPYRIVSSALKQH